MIHNIELNSECKLYLYLSLLLLLSVSHAQQLPYSQLSITDGLEDMVIFDIEQDDEGFLWLTTRTGVNRFDGTQFWTYNQADGLPHNLVRDILKTRDGRIWAGSEAGLAWLHNNQFEALPDEIWPRNVPIRALQEAKDGSIWAATYGMGVVQISTQGYPQIIQVIDTEKGLNSNRIRSLLIDKAGNLWIGDQGRVVQFIEGELKKVNWQAESSEIRALFQNNGGEIWAGTRNGITYFDGEAFVPLHFSVDLSQQTINSIHSDSQQHIWIATRDSGAYEFNQQRQLVSHANMQNGLPDNSVNIIFEDSEKNSWFGTYGGGVARLSASDVVNWKAQEALPNPNVYAITADNDGCIWIGTNGAGVSKMCDDNITHITTADGLSHNKVLTATIDHNNQPWFGTLDGLSTLADGQFINYHVEDGLSGNVVYHIIKDHDQGLWMGTNNGLSHYVNGQFKTYNHNDGLPDNRINRLWQSQDGSLWIASSNGLSHFKDGQFVNWTSADGLAANFINDIYQDDAGLIWLGTNNGLSTFDGVQFNTWSTDDGLPHNSATTILPGKNGDIWVGTNRGLAIFDGQNFIVITSREGLVFDLLNRGAGYADNGNLWFGTAQGISRFAADFKPGASTPPPIRILSVSNDNIELDTNNQISINQQDTNLTFDYTAISFQRAPDINYRYRLSSKSESEWRETRLNQIQINSLAAGNYIFEVSARIGTGNWNPVPAQVAFVVTPPFWRTPSFYLLMLAAVIAAWFYRSWRSRKHALELEKIVQERTQQLNEVNTGLDWMANHDALTRLSNRHFIHKTLASFESTKEVTPIGVLVIDLDYFKSINDQYGHNVGDVTLQLFSAMLKKITTAQQHVARWGGEEFLILCPKTQLETTVNLAQSILTHCRSLQVPTELNPQTPLNCSIGFVHLAKLDKQAHINRQLEQCIQLADKALYSAKHQGRDQMCGYKIKSPQGELTLNDFIKDPQEAINNNWIQVIS